MTTREAAQWYLAWRRVSRSEKCLWLAAALRDSWPDRPRTMATDLMMDLGYYQPKPVRRHITILNKAIRRLDAHGGAQ